MVISIARGAAMILSGNIYHKWIVRILVILFHRDIDSAHFLAGIEKERAKNA
jgi:hypothetical protein